MSLKKIDQGNMVGEIFISRNVYTKQSFRSIKIFKGDPQLHRNLFGFAGIEVGKRQTQ